MHTPEERKRAWERYFLLQINAYDQKITAAKEALETASISRRHYLNALEAL